MIYTKEENAYELFFAELRNLGVNKVNKLMLSSYKRLKHSINTVSIHCIIIICCQNICLEYQRYIKDVQQNWQRKYPIVSKLFLEGWTSVIYVLGGRGTGTTVLASGDICPKF